MSKILFLILSISINVCYSSPKIGIGLEFVTIPGIMISDDISPSFYLPILLSDYLVEPEISYYSNSENIDYTQFAPSYYTDQSNDRSQLLFACGFYKLYNYDSVRLYSGLKLGYGLTNEKSYNIYSDSTEDEETSITLISPTIGSEYLISNHFTVGGEVAMMVLNYDKKVSDGTDVIYTEKETMYLVRPKLMVRFYF